MCVTPASSRGEVHENAKRFWRSGVASIDATFGNADSRWRTYASAAEERSAASAGSFTEEARMAVTAPRLLRGGPTESQRGERREGGGGTDSSEPPNAGRPRTS